MSEQWHTVEEINAARAQREQAIPGYRPPSAFGLGLPLGDGIEFAHVNVGAGLLPAVIVAGTCGHVSGDASYELTPAELDTVLAELAPAEACTDLPHPNLWGWRALRARLGDGDRVVAVYVEDLAATGTDPHVAALRELAAGR
ncbi:hypothetical protein Cs7R123_54640 [Catellatospora sp. TT07R-123]|uniref:hypothetical protein n=1 Tax=Catellatospora sp. TT07R-123 TaxID=2733863 RepID=UPI001AFEBA0A|nr:hypothetical protein [Catellatospora sp. TT07R-123]GHJ48122.1 hypothetical protein Cs7R123_54640 [Catellatospora sp. TT07R-123]